MTDVDLLRLIDAVRRAAVARIDPAAATRAAVRTAGVSRARVIAAGKAAGPMTDGAAAALDEVLAGSFATLPDGAPAPAVAAVEVIRASHPLPDQRSADAGALALARVGDGAPWILCLSGGASSLWFAPEPPLDVEGARRLTLSLLRSGRTIAEMNEVRRKASRVAGGGLLRAAARPPECVIVLSDVRGDDPAIVGSGPCWPDGAAGAPPHVIVGSNRHLVGAAAAELEARGAAVVATTADDDREIGALASSYGEAARRWVDTLAQGTPVSSRAGATASEAPPILAIVGGGEPRLVVETGDEATRGGRCTHLAALVAHHLAGLENVAFAAIASDGVDGTSRSAGAVVTGATWTTDGARAIARFDVAPWLAERGALLPEEPSGVNVQDLHLLLVSR